VGQGICALFLGITIGSNPDWTWLYRPLILAFEYSLSRPRSSQLAAWTSNQSQKVSSRQLLEQQFPEMKEKISKGDIPLPSFWGGYRVKPHQIEFWQGRENRMHDWFRYDLQSNASWEISRLAH
jgi:pyridoxamine 5'-phosphate oxidase